MRVDPEDHDSYRWLVKYLALLGCTASILEAFWCQISCKVSWKNIHTFWHQCVLRHTTIARHSQLTGAKPLHRISYARDPRIRRNNDDYLYIEDWRWRFPVLRVGINSSRTLVVAIAHRFDQSQLTGPFDEEFCFDIPLREMSWQNELISILDKFAQDEAEEQLASITPIKK
jgi:hypothetical protein